MLGTAIERALKRAGVDTATVQRWLGGPCGCPERRDRLDRLTWWAVQAVKSTVESSREYVKELLNEDSDNTVR